MGQRSTPTPKIFFSRVKVKKLRFFRFWITFKCLSPLQILLVTITKTKKSPSPYVFCHRMRLKRRTTFPFIFSDRYDLKEACKHICEVPMTNRKVFQPLKFRHLIHKNAIFLRSKNPFLLKFPLSDHQNQKITINLRFLS